MGKDEIEDEKKQVKKLVSMSQNSDLEEKIINLEETVESLRKCMFLVMINAQGIYDHIRRNSARFHDTEMNMDMAQFYAFCESQFQENFSDFLDESDGEDDAEE